VTEVTGKKLSGLGQQRMLVDGVTMEGVERTLVISEGTYS